MPLKRFFVGGTRSEDGEDVAWDTIRVKLQEIIDKEDKQNPLSDDDLVKALSGHGLNVARRTITKYRKKMGIPSSRQRRDWSLVEVHLTVKMTTTRVSNAIDPRPPWRCDVATHQGGHSSRLACG